MTGRQNKALKNENLSDRAVTERQEKERKIRKRTK